MTDSRRIARILPAHDVLEGGGFLVHRPFPVRGVEQVDPFLMIDELGPVTYGPGEAVGAPAHPHRGFETVTYVIEGGGKHKDSAGHSGELHAGDVQWMTAGRGVVHDEAPSDALLRGGGRHHGFQIWVNLPRSHKMIAPRYQDIRSADIPTWTSDDETVWAKVIAGTANGVHGAAATHIPIGMVHYRVQPGGVVQHGVTDAETALAYLISGRAECGSDRKRVEAKAAVEFERSGTLVEVRNAGDTTLEFLMLTGPVIGEPLARYGPFVMNSLDELQQAFDDFHAGKLGAIAE